MPLPAARPDRRPGRADNGRARSSCRSSAPFPGAGPQPVAFQIREDVGGSNMFPGRWRLPAARRRRQQRAPRHCQSVGGRNSGTAHALSTELGLHRRPRACRPARGKPQQVIFDMATGECGYAKAGAALTPSRHGRWQREIKVLIVDDSAVVRQVVPRLLSAATGQMRVMAAPARPAVGDGADEDAVAGRDRAGRGNAAHGRHHLPRKIMAERPTPVVICSTLTEKGARDHHGGAGRGRGRPSSPSPSWA